MQNVKGKKNAKIKNNRNKSLIIESDVQSKFSSGLLDFCDKLSADADLYFSTNNIQYNAIVLIFN